jgi:hypothetical protein
MHFIPFVKNTGEMEIDIAIGAVGGSPERIIEGRRQAKGIRE